MPRPEVIALFGPTGVGKTAVALALAELLRERGHDPVVVSADALQVYRGLEIITGAPTLEERRALEHRLVGVRPVTASFSVGEYAPLAHAEIDSAVAAGRLPIVVGGTGLYLRAALTDLSLRPPPAPGVRERLEADAGVRGVPALHQDLRARDPEAARRIEPTDRTRVLRALELLESGAGAATPSSAAVGTPSGAGTGTPSGAGLAPPPADELWTAEVRRPTLLAGLVREREDLYARIDARVEAMVAAGAAEEVRRARAAGASATARAALGFEELARGDVEGMKRATRRLAKRQLTWMRKLAGVLTVDLTEASPEQAATEVARLAGMVPTGAPAHRRRLL